METQSMDFFGLFLLRNQIIFVALPNLYHSHYFQLFKGTFYYCSGENLTGIITRQDCDNRGYKWKNQKYNFDDLVQALMSLFVLSSRDGWVNIMYTGLDAVGVDKQVSDYFLQGWEQSTTKCYNTGLFTLPLKVYCFVNLGVIICML